MPKVLSAKGKCRLSAQTEFDDEARGNPLDEATFHSGSVSRRSDFRTQRSWSNGVAFLISFFVVVSFWRIGILYFRATGAHLPTWLNSMNEVFTNLNYRDTSLHLGQLPRLLYMGDVPVTNTFAGGALLYRLLTFYPADKLVIICSVTPGMKTLPGMKYYHWGARFPRLLHTRFSSLYCLRHFWRHKQIPPLITKVADSFQPEAVLSFSHVSAWLSDWRLSVARSISFHLIAHDDYAFLQLLPKIARPWAERTFTEAYRGASSRFCISPGWRNLRNDIGALLKVFIRYVIWQRRRLIKSPVEPFAPQYHLLLLMRDKIMGSRPFVGLFHSRVSLGNSDTECWYSRRNISTWQRGLMPHPSCSMRAPLFPWKNCLIVYVKKQIVLLLSKALMLSDWR